jgi:cytochrome P450
VSVPINAFHMDVDRYGPNAHIFKPACWLDVASQAHLTPFLVFSTGANKCVGMKLAMLELHILLVYAALKLHLEIARSDFDDNKFRYGVRNWRSTEFHYPLKMKVTPIRSA